MKILAESYAGIILFHVSFDFHILLEIKEN